jgi:thymidylate synthase
VEPDEYGDMSLSMHMEQRSCDLFLGVPFNIASYALLTHMLAQVCGYKVGKLHMTLLDYHVYVTESQSHEAQVMEQLKRTPYSMPKLVLDTNIKNINDFTMSSATLSDYRHHPKLIAPLSTKVVDRK